MATTDSPVLPAPIERAEANYWRAQYFQALIELSKANKGIRRLKAKCERLQKRHKEL